MLGEAIGNSGLMELVLQITLTISLDAHYCINAISAIHTTVDLAVPKQFSVTLPASGMIFTNPMR